MYQFDHHMQGPHISPSQQMQHSFCLSLVGGGGMPPVMPRIGVLSTATPQHEEAAVARVWLANASKADSRHDTHGAILLVRVASCD